MAEREWDSQDSTAYHDGYEQGEADACQGLPRNDRGGEMPLPWTDGYRDGYEKGSRDD